MNILEASKFDFRNISTVEKVVGLPRDFLPSLLGEQGDVVADEGGEPR